ncbi:hypothetical protein [Actinophytocola sp.]|uniref:hypothetical protein n=1 Tax=Actinophytocola sp. TaxID=1872138 RepID=UPI002ED3C38B
MSWVVTVDAVSPKLDGGWCTLYWHVGTAWTTDGELATRFPTRAAAEAALADEIARGRGWACGIERAHVRPVLDEQLGLFDEAQEGMHQ